MPTTYPYMLSNNKIGAILKKFQSAAKPSKFTHELLKKMGFASSNDRAIIPLLKKLGFISDSGTPTEYYDRLKDSTDHAYVIGERIRELYSDLYSINTEIHKAGEDEIKGAFSRITGGDEVAVGRYYATFKALTALAKFGASPSIDENTEDDNVAPLPFNALPAQTGGIAKANFHYNIQIHLPATTDISVYNAIFKSIRENLLN